MSLVDSHCHLNFPDFKDDVEAVVARAKAAGVGVMQTICTEMAEFDEILALTERFEGVYCSVGVHPHDSGKFELVPSSVIIDKTQHDKVIGIGETGLDYYYDHSDRGLQKASFINHIHAAQATSLPIIVHTREADADTIDIISQEYQRATFKGVIHCFTSTQQLADKMLELGFYISFSGIITFKNSAAVREVLKTVPLDRILIETDSPFLAPVPHRGQRNEPSYVKEVSKMVAEVKQISEEEVASATTTNFFRLFYKAVNPVVCVA
jgi:TatD DNase family protein